MEFSPSLIEGALGLASAYLMHQVKKREADLDRLREGHAAQETRIAVLENGQEGLKAELLANLSAVKEAVADLRDDLRRHMENERETIAATLRGVLAEGRGRG